MAGQIAKNSNFPFIKVCRAHDMAGFSESVKCAQLRKIFEDAYRSATSCILLDDIERLFDYNPVGPRYSNVVVMALWSWFNKPPPKVRINKYLINSQKKFFYFI